MLTLLSSFSVFIIHTFLWMCLLALAMSTVNAIHGVFIPLAQRGAVAFALMMTLVVIFKSFESMLETIFAAIVGFFWFLIYGTFTVIRNLIYKA